MGQGQVGVSSNSNLGDETYNMMTFRDWLSHLNDNAYNLSQRRLSLGLFFYQYFLGLNFCYLIVPGDKSASLH